MAKELYCVAASVVGIVLLIGLGLYLGGSFMGEFLKYLLPVVGVVFLAKRCTTYLNRKSLQKKS